MIDPRISLMGRVPDLGQTFTNMQNRLNSRETQNQNTQLFDMQMEQGQQQMDDDRDNRRLRSVAEFSATQILPNLGNPQLLVSKLQDRINVMNNDPNMDSTESIEALALVQSGDFAGLQRLAQESVALFNMRNGITPKAQEGFTLSQGQQRFDAAGNNVASVAPKAVPVDKPKVGTYRFIETPTGIAKLNTVTGEQEETTLNSKELELARKQTLEQTKAQLSLDDTTFDRSKKIRDRHDKLSGEFIKVRDSFDRVRESEQTAAGDIALIFNYMKMLDPGSVVRESEFATAQNAGGIDDRVWNSYNRLLTGERLNPKQRKEFESQAEKLFDVAGVRNKSLIRETISLGKQFGVTESNIFGNQPQTQGNQPVILKFDAQGNQIQ
jgi:hypothetical protein